MLVLFGYFLSFVVPALSSDASLGHDADRHANTVDLSQTPLELVLAGTLIAIIVWLGWTKQTRLTTRPAWGGLWYMIPPILFMGGLLLIGIISASGQSVSVSFSASYLAALLALTLLVGTFEEGLFRGVVFYGFEAKWGPLIALAASSVLFGAMHYVNWIGGQDFSETSSQAVAAGLSGILYGALALRTGSIWPGAVLHCLWDTMVTLNGRISAVRPPLPTDGAVNLDGDPVTESITFVVQYFEPLYGLIVLLGYYWWKRSNARRAG
ncbi:CPBP family intramembrane glutamic endopeptidase [Roseobacter sp. HKCCD8431]|uniref:CPBP family intramembrane glutamic endopeptidase n=2 Tax=Roseobacter TaxID=2433 RepID=UPI001491F9ED|nr:CPBP family intramembrane glutamic endopeptidase [Roseobacter sp. HKCCD8431]NOB05558.1 CPBP family intramembrane metalloprotease [Roseobacter sp. HKCCD8721]